MADSRNLGDILDPEMVKPCIDQRVNTWRGLASVHAAPNLVNGGNMLVRAKKRGPIRFVLTQCWSDTRGCPQRELDTGFSTPVSMSQQFDAT